MNKKEVFEGIKVADFSWMAVGTQVSRVLAEHGATVIRVESHKVPDMLRFGAPFVDGKPGIDRSQFGAAYNTNKYGITIDLKNPKFECQCHPTFSPGRECLSLQAKSWRRLDTPEFLIR